MKSHLKVLDGWRAISILLVLASHMLPLGPKAWELNEAAGKLGMNIFFTLSGFLITTTLLRNSNPVEFFIRRFMRIVPLAFLYLLIVLPFLHRPAWDWLTHFTFTSNYLSTYRDYKTLHFWSLCVEVHFYVLIGLLVAWKGKRALYLQPFLLVICTILIIGLDGHDTMLSHFRMDQIFAGGCLGLLYTGSDDKHNITRFDVILTSLAFFALSLPSMRDMDWLRTYFAMALIAYSLFAKDSRMFKFLEHPTLKYIATISFALYVIHPATSWGWLGEGHGIEKYLKRPISFALTFGLAHLSTFYFENRFIELGKNWINERRLSRA